MPESAASHYRATGVPFGRFPFAKSARKTRIRISVGGRSSMVELQIVVLAVAGSSPVGHPRALPRAKSQIREPKSQTLGHWQDFWDLVLGFGFSAVRRRGCRHKLFGPH